MDEKGVWGMKYSIIMPYHKKRMLRDTLISYKNHYADRDDYEVIVLEDCKNIADTEEHEALLGIVREFSESILLIHMETNFENCYAPSKMFNYGVSIAKGEYIVLTNPECVHKTNVLAQFDEGLEKDKDSYIVSACYDATGIDYKFLSWYQHSVHMPRGLHWCSVMSKAQYNKLNGFDEGYSHGFGREDVDFFRRVEESGMKVVFMDDIVVVHIHHPHMPAMRSLVVMNQLYYASKWGAMDTR